MHATQNELWGSYQDHGLHRRVEGAAFVGAPLIVFDEIDGPSHVHANGDPARCARCPAARVDGVVEGLRRISRDAARRLVEVVEVVS